LAALLESFGGRGVGLRFGGCGDWETGFAGEFPIFVRGGTALFAIHDWEILSGLIVAGVRDGPEQAGRFCRWQKGCKQLGG
jgi:hypothetical protein